MTTKKILAGKDQADAILRCLSKNPKITAARVAEILGVASKRGVQNRMIFMLQINLIREVGYTGQSGAQQRVYELAGPLKEMLAANRLDADQRVKKYKATVKRAAESKADRVKAAQEDRMREDMPTQKSGAPLAGGGYVESTPTGRIYRLEAFRKMSNDCIGESCGAGRAGKSSLAGEFSIPASTR